ncbi:MAG: polysaccharide biosynthesis protein [Gammaproteobacteria bacterium]|nr:polysaccharide biosynthesis protein [Gammaproteobacteria bacterium]
MAKFLLNLSRLTKQLIMLLTDAVLLVLILLASFSIRLGYWYFPESDLWWVIIGSPVIATPIFIYFGLYRSVIHYMSFKDVRSIVQAVSLYALVWGVVGFMAAVEGIPRSVILINWILSLVMMGGLRVMIRTLLGRNSGLAHLKDNLNNQKRVLIYGAGDAGVQLSSALEHTAEYRLVGFIDDSQALQGSQIRGLRIYALEGVSQLIERFKVSEILIAIPSISRTKRLSIVNKLELYPVVVRALPGVAELAQGNVVMADLRKVSIVDLLGRDVVEPNQDLLGKNITNKTVVVTGAGGSIGSELCHQIVSLKPKALILYELSELALYTIEQTLSKLDSGVDIYPLLGSVNNQARLTQVFQQFSVNTIYHAAAYKHVPMVEFNNTEGVHNNVFGTLSAAQAAIDAKVKTFVLISTDKAVRPTNTMGATKRCAELVLQALSTTQTNTLFTMVRFGNVLGSSGSVIPLFTRQIKAGGPITVTDENIIRYFMAISEAVELVIQAGAMASGGEVFVLDMGKPVRIVDLAKQMIHLSGLEVKNTKHPDGDIEITYTGLRPGEKLYEELLIGDKVKATNNPLIMRAEEHSLPWAELQPILTALSIAINDSNHTQLRVLLEQVVTDFKPQCDITDILYKKPITLIQK